MVISCRHRTCVPSLGKPWVKKDMLCVVRKTDELWRVHLALQENTMTRSRQDWKDVYSDRPMTPPTNPAYGIATIDSVA